MMTTPASCAKTMVFIHVMHTAHDALAAVDLNLLRVLAVVLHEGHVTRAATRLGLTQSATSHALARLRAELGDPLLVRGAGGRMVLTERAQALAPVVTRILDELAAAWRGAAFDPATAQRTFHLGAGDLAELVVLPRLAARLARQAPGVQLFVHAAPLDSGEALAAGTLDVVLSPVRTRDTTTLPSGCYQRPLFDESFATAMRAGHPAARGRLTLDRFCALDHLLVAPRGTAGGFVDDALAAIGRTRRVAVAVPHFLVAPAVVAATDLVVTLPARIIAAVARSHRLASRPPPLALADFTLHAIWHERTHDQAAHQWLREQIAAAARAS